jgi:fructose-1,6-bisphosphatase/inositol monophosphatase family enzyme
VAFLVDPIDGTRAFVDGAPDYAVMVALVSGGASVASWICLPSRGHTYVAERGSGAWRDGVRMAPPDRPDEPRVLIGPTRDDAALVERARRVGLPSIGVGRRMWAGRHYTALADGEVDALGYWAGWPWDHAPGAVLVRELGGVVAGMDGKDYRPKDVAEGVVVAADRQLHDVVRGLMGPED